MAKNTVGRPPKYKNKEEIEQKIEDYFAWCDGETLKGEDGTIVYDKKGKPVIIKTHPPTITGLALALGFATRQSLLDYQGKKEFLDTITRAKSMVERYAEERLFDKEGSSGAQFSLRNNFKGWNEKQITELDIEEQKARIEALKRKNTDGPEEDDGGVEIINDAPTGEIIGNSDTEVSEDI